MSFSRTFLLAVALATAGVSTVAAHSFTLGAIKIGHPWTRATPPAAQVAGGYLSITNTGAEADTLVAVSFAAAERSEVHEMAVKDGVMTMRPLEKGLEIAPGATVALKPSGYHLMFMGLKQPLKQGESVKGTLEFAHAGKVEVEFVVDAMGATGEAHAH